jgi:hypothetical protein
LPEIYRLCANFPQREGAGFASVAWAGRLGSGVLEQLDEFVSGEPTRAIRIFEGGIGKRSFAGVQRENAFLDGVLRDQAMNGDGAILTDTMGPICGLLLDRGIPPRIQEEDMIRGGEVETRTTSSQREQHDRRAIVALEAFHDGAAITRGAI